MADETHGATNADPARALDEIDLTENGTSATLTPMEFETYWQAWRTRLARQRRDEEEKAGRALALARRLAQLLVERYSATRVVLVGSLARGDFRSGSDIDLAVEGVAPAAFFAAGAELERVAGWVGVDLVPLETASVFFREEAERDGVALV